MNKKGGVTIYIIIGIVLLILSTTVILFASDIRQFVVESRNPEVKDVRLLVESCMNNQVNDALRLILLQGGYIDLPSRLDSAGAYLPPPPSPLKVPFWWYKGVSYVPSKQKMETEISNYVSSNLDSCLDFSTLPQLEVETESKEVEISLAESRLSSYLEMETKVKINGKEIKLKSYATDVPTKLLHLFEAAQEVMNLENKNGFLESLTLDMIATSNGAGDSPNLPFDGFELSCGRGNGWSIQYDIIDTIQKLVKFNLHYLSFEGLRSDYDLDFEDNRQIKQEVCVEENEGICKKYISQEATLFDYYLTKRKDGTGIFRESYVQTLDSKEDYSDIKVKAEYDKSFGMNVDVSPRKGDTVRGMKLDIPIIGECFKVYHHFYTIDYPVIFSLSSGDEIFNFATPVNIENNVPVRSVSPYSLGDYIYNPDQEQYCDNALNLKEVFAKDKVTGQFLTDAEITYQCVRFSCPLGKTDVPRFDGVPVGGVPTLKVGFPNCVNGFLVVNKPGYQEEVVQVTVDESSQLPVPELTPLKDLEIKVNVLELQGNTVLIRELEKDESVLITLSKLDGTFDDTYLFTRESNEFQDPLQLILDDGNYEFDAKLIRDQDLKGGLHLDKWNVLAQEISGVLKVYVLQPQGVTDMDSFVDAYNNQILQKSNLYSPEFQ